jgi:hypothetical protein
MAGVGSARGLLLRRMPQVKTSSVESSSRADLYLGTNTAALEGWEIEAHPRAALVGAVLRRIAYTLLSLFRSVTQRSDERRNVPWKHPLDAGSPLCYGSAGGA